MQAIKITIITFIITFLTACGGGGDSGSDVRTGQFKDSEVKGLNYKTATQGGVTDIRGTFKYLDNEMVTFALGNMELGSAIGAEVLYPKDIVAKHIEDKDGHAIKIGQVLQSLDSNKYPDDGIDVTNQFVAEMTDNIDFEAVDDLQDLINTISKSTKTALVQKEVAKDHIDRTIFNEIYENTPINFPPPTETTVIRNYFPKARTKTTRTAVVIDGRTALNDEIVKIPPYSGTATLSFERISVPINSTHTIKINNEKLTFNPANSRSVWLLAKKSGNTDITSIAANIEHDRQENDYRLTTSALVLELEHQGLVDYFSIGLSNYPTRHYINHTVAFSYRGQIDHCYYGYNNHDYYSAYNYTADGTLSTYTAGSVPLTLNGKPYDKTQEFSIGLNKASKTVVIKYGEKTGYFDISNAHFGDLNTANAKFFIVATNFVDLFKEERRIYSGFYYERNLVFEDITTIDNIKVNNEAFDDFSTNTLDSEKWDSGKFPATSSCFNPYYF